MYKASIRALMRHSIDKLNNGDYSLMLKMASPDFELAFPGENSWSTMFRPQQRGRAPHVTHRGIEEAGAFADRFVAEGIQFEIEDILVNGPPWNTRIAVRVRDFVPGDDGSPMRTTTGPCSSSKLRWGRLIRWEDYEDTERVAAWDRDDGGHQDVRLTTTPGPDAEDSRHPMQSVRRSATYLSRSDDIIKGVPMRQLELCWPGRGGRGDDRRRGHRAGVGRRRPPGLRNGAVRRQGGARPG